MVQNAFAGGANTAPTPSRRGRGNRGGMGGATGMAGKNKGKGNGKKPPDVGLYGFGKVGDAAANQNPEAYLQSVFGSAGQMGGSPGTDWEAFQNEYAIPKMVTDYQSAVGAGNQNLSIQDWVSQQYGGAGYVGGKHGKPSTFNAGTLAAPVQSMYGTYSANQNPQTFANSRQMAQGLNATNGNQQFQDWLTQVYNPQVEGQWRAKVQQDPTLNFDAFYNGLDPQAARAAYANRPPQQRLPTGGATTGRWSWWS